MNLTHLDLAHLVATLYGEPGSAPAEWVYLSNPDANVYMGIVRRGDTLIVVLRGSFDFLDWWHDIIAPPINPRGRPEIRQVHTGFYSGTPEAWDILATFIQPGDRLVFAGHSLGAARALILGAHAIVHGFRPRFIARWGEPAPFKPEGNSILLGIPGVSYRNSASFFSDPVTKSTPVFGYQPITAFADVSAEPLAHKWDPAELHHFPLYLSVTPGDEIA